MAAGKTSTLTTTCCNCGTRQPLAAGLTDDDGKRFGVAMGELPAVVARAAIAYLRLFKPPKTELRTSRATTIVSELAALVSPGTVCKDERGGIRRPAGPAIWVAAIEQMLATPPSDLPLTSHNYLRKVAAQTQALLIEYGIASARAEQAGHALADHLAQHWGGQVISIPKDAYYIMSARDLDLLADQRAGMSIIDLARKYELGERGVRKVIKRAEARSIHLAQGTLPF